MKKTQRWMELLNILVEEQNFQTVAELAEQVAVSSRTIHSDLQDTSFLQLLHGAELIKKPNIGIRLHCTQKQREAITNNKGDLPRTFQFFLSSYFLLFTYGSAYAFNL